MKALRLMVAVVLMIGMVGKAPAREEKAEVSKDKLIGTWVAVKAEEGTLPVGSTVEFLSDGKAKTIRKSDGKELVLEGTYTLSGDKVTLTRKLGNDELQTALTIKKMTATELVLEREGKTVEFKRK